MKNLDKKLDCGKHVSELFVMVSDKECNVLKQFMGLNHSKVCAAQAPWELRKEKLNKQGHSTKVIQPAWISLRPSVTDAWSSRVAMWHASMASLVSFL